MPDVLNALAAFVAEHQRCGDLDGGNIWLASAARKSSTRLRRLPLRSSSDAHTRHSLEGDDLRHRPRLTLCATPGCARRRSSVDFGHAMEVNHGARGYWNRGCGLASGRVCLEYACSNSYQSDVHRGTAVHARRGLVAAEPRDLRHARNGSRNGSKIARTSSQLTLRLAIARTGRVAFL